MVNPKGLNNQTYNAMNYLNGRMCILYNLLKSTSCHLSTVSGIVHVGIYGCAFQHNGCSDPVP